MDDDAELLRRYAAQAEDLMRSLLKTDAAASGAGAAPAPAPEWVVECVTKFRELT